MNSFTTTGTGSFGYLTAADISASDNLTIGQWIYHGGENVGHTGIRMTDKRIRIRCGDINYIDMDDSTTAPHNLTLNDDANNVDFKVKGVNGVGHGNPLLCTDASTMRVGMHGVGSDNVQAGLHIADNFWVSGSNGHITASGNISSSGTIVGSNLSGTNTGNVSLGGSLDYITISGQTITRNAIDLTTDVTGVLPSANLDSDTAHLSTDQTFTGKKTFNQPIVANSISASGDISSSGDFYSGTNKLVKSSQTGSFLTTVDISSDTNLVGGTNITLTGDTLNVDDAFLKNDADDETTGTITAGGFTTTGNISAKDIFLREDATADSAPTLQLRNDNNAISAQMNIMFSSGSPVQSAGNDTAKIEYVPDNLAKALQIDNYQTAGVIDLRTGGFAFQTSLDWEKNILVP